jgi:hypothetical protein
MRKLAIVLFAYCIPVISAASEQVEKVTPTGAWLQDGVKWTKAPAAINVHLHSAVILPRRES